MENNNNVNVPKEMAVLLSALMLHSSNMRNIHWTCAGHNFKTIHSLSEGYYKMMANDADKVAEMGLQIGISPVNYIDVLDKLRECDGRNFLIVEADKKYYTKEFLQCSYSILNDIIWCIEELICSLRAEDLSKLIGIISTLENMHSEYTHVLNYFLRRFDEDTISNMGEDEEVDMSGVEDIASVIADEDDDDSDDEDDDDSEDEEDNDDDSDEYNEEEDISESLFFK